MVLQDIEGILFMQFSELKSFQNVFYISNNQNTKYSYKTIFNTSTNTVYFWEKVFKIQVQNTIHVFKIAFLILVF